MYQKIIIRMPNWLGDAVMGTPLINDLRTHFPHAHITAMCQGSVGDLLKGNPYLNEIFSFSKIKGFSKFLTTQNFIQFGREKQYDLGILLPNSFSSAWWFWRLRIKKRIGFSTDGRRFLLNQAVPVPIQRNYEHLVLTYKRLLSPLGIPLSSTRPELFLTSEEVQVAHTFLQHHQFKNKIIGINPGAAFGSAKCWPPEYFRALIEKMLSLTDYQFILFGDKSTIPLIDQISRGFPSRVMNLAGKTSLRELMALVTHCSLFLTNDSGPMHIASALNIPLIALFGSTDPSLTGPYNQGTILRKKVPCSPCFKRVCPIDFPCMKEIQVEEVYEKIILIIQ